MRISDWSSDVCSSDLTLGLRKGAEAIALIKASAIIIAVDDGVPLKLSARNQLHGTVSALRPGAVNSEVALALQGGNVVTAIITNASAEALELREGSAAIALFKASRSEEHTSELQSLMRISYAVFCLKTKKHTLQCETI